MIIVKWKNVAVEKDPFYLVAFAKTKEDLPFHLSPSGDCIKNVFQTMEGLIRVLKQFTRIGSMTGYEYSIIYENN
jgi:hypothetical protein